MSKNARLLIVLFLCLGLTAWLISHYLFDYESAQLNLSASTTANSPSNSPSITAAKIANAQLSNAELAALANPATTKEERQRVLQKQLALAEFTLATYKAGTQYGTQTQPATEHPDQLYPNQPVSSELALRKADGGFDANIKIRTSQSHVYIGGAESVVFNITAVNAEGQNQGQPVPLLVSRAVAKGLSFNTNPNSTNTGSSQSNPQWTMNFTDDGTAGDAVAADQIYSAVLAPSQTGLSNFSGTIRVELAFQAGGSVGITFFDVQYSPTVPLAWRGAARDNVDAGSLLFSIPAKVTMAGRYVISGRVDDALGKPFAFLIHNEVLNEGEQDVKLLLYGKLIRDYKPKFPLYLRDVDGYVLKETGDFARVQIPRLIGRQLTSKNYPLDVFTTQEASSEQRTRYINELEEDVRKAQDALR